MKRNEFFQAGQNESAKKKKLIEAGVNLLALKEFNATSLEDICLEANIKKGSFHYYFKNKADFAKYTIRHFGEIEIKRFKEASFRKLADPFERVLGRLI
jgi:TetR/AcrR family transcriptional repressor of nem operon